MTVTGTQQAASGDVVVIQRNPTSGTGRRRSQLLEFIQTLRAAGMTVRSFKDRDACDDWVRSSPDPGRLRCIVAAGGDGTLVNVAQRHPGVPLAVFPMGTENLFARHLRIPRSGRLAAQVVISGNQSSFDTATVNGERFLIMVSAGVDADVVRRLSQERRGNISHLSYLRPILSSFWGYSYPELTVLDEQGDVIGEGTHVIVANLPEYGFRMPFAEAAAPGDGLLDVAIFTGRGTCQTMWHAVRMRLGFSVESAVIRSRHARVSVTSTADQTALQFDGDPGGCCPAEIAVEPRSMTCLVPTDFVPATGEPR